MKLLLRLSLFVLVISSLFLSGCAGEATIGIKGDFSGAYYGSYSRATGEMLIGVDSAGRIDIAITDSANGSFIGTGLVNTDNTFSVLCTSPGGANVTVNGTLSGSGAGRTAAGNVSGSFSVAYTAAFANSPNQSMFAGHYEGFTSGDAPGTFSGDVDASGHFVGTLVVSGRLDSPMTGDISSTGFCTIDAASRGVGAPQTTFKGVFYLNPSGTGILARGGWGNSFDEVGNWEGGLANGE